MMGPCIASGAPGVGRLAVDLWRQHGHAGLLTLEHTVVSEPLVGRTAVAFGHAVSLACGVLVVGDYRETTTAEMGSAQIWRRLNTGFWVFEARLTAPSEEANSRYGFAVAMDHDIAVVSAPRRSRGGDTNVGMVWIYEHSGGTWNMICSLQPTDLDAGAEFGYSVACDAYANLIVVGAPGQGAGRTYVFQRQSPTVWNAVASVDGSVADNDSRFGSAVDIHGLSVVVGVPACSDGFGGGCAYFYDFDGISALNEVSRYLPPAANYGNLGAAVAIWENQAVLGASDYDDSGVQRGCAVVMKRTATGWVSTQRLEPTHAPQDFELFGTGVDVIDGYMSIGSPGHNHGGDDYTGAVYLYHNDCIMRSSSSSTLSSGSSPTSTSSSTVSHVTSSTSSLSSQSSSLSSLSQEPDKWFSQLVFADVSRVGRQFYATALVDLCLPDRAYLKEYARDDNDTIGLGGVYAGVQVAPSQGRVRDNAKFRVCLGTVGVTRAQAAAREWHEHVMSGTRGVLSDARSEGSLLGLSALEYRLI